MINKQGKKVVSGLLLALALISISAIMPTPVNATARDGEVRCHYVCCLEISGWCVWTGCIECLRYDAGLNKWVPADV